MDWMAHVSVKERVGCSKADWNPLEGGIQQGVVAMATRKGCGVQVYV